MLAVWVHALGCANAGTLAWLAEKADRPVRELLWVLALLPVAFLAMIAVYPVAAFVFANSEPPNEGCGRGSRGRRAAQSSSAWQSSRGSPWPPSPRSSRSGAYSTTPSRIEAATVRQKRLGDQVTIGLTCEGKPHRVQAVLTRSSVAGKE